MSNNVDNIVDKYGNLLAVIIHSGFRHTGVYFHTNESDSQQVGTIQQLAGHKIARHYHPPRERVLNDTQEVIMVRRGKLRVHFYSPALEHLTSHDMGPLDVLIHMKGGHSFEVLEDCDLVEVKQGPYDSTKDKIQF